jgi:four helix bundle protein
MRLRPYQKLIAWQEAHRLCLKIYESVRTFPPSEKFGLADQMRRASASIPMNIAEGNARQSKKDHARFLETAIASLDELHYQTLLSKDLKYMSDNEFESINGLLQRVGYLTSRLRTSIL